MQGKDAIEWVFYHGDKPMRKITLVHDGNDYIIYDQGFMEGKWTNLFIDSFKQQHFARSMFAGRVVLALISNGFCEC